MDDFFTPDNKKARNTQKQKALDVDRERILSDEFHTAVKHNRHEDVAALTREMTRLGFKVPSRAETKAPSATDDFFTPDQQPQAQPQAQTKAQEPEWFSPGSTSDALVRGAANAATLGLSNYIAPAISSVINGRSYKENQADLRAGNDKAAAESPWAYGGGALAGSVLPGAALIRGGVAAGKALGGSVKAHAATQVAAGAGAGGLEGYAQHGDAWEGGIGATIGTAAVVLPPAISSLADKRGAKVAAKRLEALLEDGSPHAMATLEKMIGTSPEMVARKSGGATTPMIVKEFVETLRDPAVSRGVKSDLLSGRNKLVDGAPSAIKKEINAQEFGKRATVAGIRGAKDGLSWGSLGALGSSIAAPEHMLTATLTGVATGAAHGAGKELAKLGVDVADNALVRLAGRESTHLLPIRTTRDSQTQRLDAILRKHRFEPDLDGAHTSSQTAGPTQWGSGNTMPKHPQTGQSQGSTNPRNVLDETGQQPLPPGPSTVTNSSGNSASSAPSTNTNVTLNELGSVASPQQLAQGLSPERAGIYDALVRRGEDPFVVRDMLDEIPDGASPNDVMRVLNRGLHLLKTQYDEQGTRLSDLGNAPKVASTSGAPLASLGKDFDRGYLRNAYSNQGVDAGLVQNMTEALPDGLSLSEVHKAMSEGLAVFGQEAKRFPQGNTEAAGATMNQARHVQPPANVSHMVTQPPKAAPVATTSSKQPPFTPEEYQKMVSPSSEVKQIRERFTRGEYVHPDEMDLVHAHDKKVEGALAKQVAYLDEVDPEKLKNQMANQSGKNLVALVRNNPQVIRHLDNPSEDVVNSFLMGSTEISDRAALLKKVPLSPELVRGITSTTWAKELNSSLARDPRLTDSMILDIAESNPKFVTKYLPVEKLTDDVIETLLQHPDAVVPLFNKLGKKVTDEMMVKAKLYGWDGLNGINFKPYERK
jgi:hypothetical protein